MSANEFLTYRDKYVGNGKGSKSKGMASTNRIIPARITKEQEEGLKEFLIDRIRENSFYVDVDHNIQPALFIAKVNQLGI